jgi:hypothetical protein
LLYILLGWTLPPSPGLSLHPLAVGLVLLHWRLNGGECILTTWERRLSGIQKQTDPSEAAENAVQRTFSGRLIHWSTGRWPKAKTLKRLVYTLPLIAAALSTLRLLARH